MYRIILTSDQAKKARTKLGLSQGRVATTTGLNRTYLSLFENGKYLLPDSDLKKLRGYYSDFGVAFDETNTVNDNDLPQMQAEYEGGDRIPVMRVMEGFAIPTNMDDNEVERILSEYSDNQEKILRLCRYDIRKHHSSIPFLFWDSEIDEAEVEKRTKEVLILMAKNYTLIELLHGHTFEIHTEDHTNSALCTTGDFIRAIITT